jgi:RHS repeat-associated protein
MTGMTAAAQHQHEPATWHDENHDGDHDDTDEGRYHFLHDANFNVVATTDTSHDPITSNTVERYHYSPYGEVTHLEANYSVKTTQASSVGNEFLFTGRRLDPETGLQYSRWRYLHLQMGRWLTRDPIGYDGSPHNLYEYVSSRPIIAMEPLGLVVVICKCRCYKVPCDHDSKLEYGKQFPVTINTGPRGNAAEQCRQACDARSTGFNTGDLRCLSEGWDVENALPSGQGLSEIDMCAGEWWSPNASYSTCWSCCVRANEFWKTVEAGTSVMAIRIPKKVVHPGQKQLQTWLVPARKCLPRTIRPTIVQSQVAGRVFFWAFIAEGVYDVGAEAICAGYCANR